MSLNAFTKTSAHQLFGRMGGALERYRRRQNALAQLQRLDTRERDELGIAPRDIPVLARRAADEQ